jgi:hypothetical protein
MQNAICPIYSNFGLLQNPSIPKGFWWGLHPKLLQFKQNFENLEQLHM